MMSKKCTQLILVMLIISSFIGIFTYNKKYKNTVIMAYVDDPCGGCFTDNSPCKPCTVEIETRVFIEKKLNDLEVENVEIHVKNIQKQEYALEFFQLISQYKIEKYELPFIKLNDNYISGWDNIKKQFPLFLQQNGLNIDKGKLKDDPNISLVPSNKNTIIYFKLPGCKECELVELLLDDLKLNNSHLNIYTYNLNINDNLEIFKQYCINMDLDFNKTLVPSIIIDNHILEGYEEISTFLPTYISQNKGNDTLVAD